MRWRRRVPASVQPVEVEAKGCDEPRACRLLRSAPDLWEGDPMTRRVLSVWGALLGASLLLASEALAYTNLYVFGDSLSDVGNLCPTPCPSAPVPPYALGRFSNGPVWVDGVAAGLGFPMSASGSGGNNYARGGATSVGVRNSQIPTYLTDHGGAADGSALYILLAGGNDGLGGGNPVNAANNILASITSLRDAGANYFLIGNLPDLSLVPAQLGNPAAQAFSNSFNSTLASGLPSISGITVYTLDLYTLVNQAVANPALAGFTNVNQACWNGTTACANPNEYLFWDAVHPTAASHALLGQLALQSIPEPGTGSLVLLGLVMLLAKRRRR
jgi:phospholipase/lecithinase/hemolysin